MDQAQAVVSTPNASIVRRSGCIGNQRRRVVPDSYRQARTRTVLRWVARWATVGIPSFCRRRFCATYSASSAVSAKRGPRLQPLRFYDRGGCEVLNTAASWNKEMDPRQIDARLWAISRTVTFPQPTGPAFPSL